MKHDDEDYELTDPYPVSQCHIDSEAYVKLVPDPVERTGISWYLMGEGYRLAAKRYGKRVAELELLLDVFREDHANDLKRIKELEADNTRKLKQLAIANEIVWKEKDERIAELEARIAKRDSDVEKAFNKIWESAKEEVL